MLGIYALQVTKLLTLLPTQNYVLEHKTIGTAPKANFFVARGLARGKRSKVWSFELFPAEIARKNHRTSLRSRKKDERTTGQALAQGKSLKVWSLKLWDTNNASTEQKVGFGIKAMPRPDKKLPFAHVQKPFLIKKLCLHLKHKSQ
jgi:hypothetical protein